MPDDQPERGSILLTGATGFIGRRLQSHLLDAGYSVRAFVRHDSKRLDQIDVRVERIEGSLEDPQALARALAGTKAVIHCAGAVRGRTYADFSGVNVDGVRSLANAVQRLSIQPALLHLSSLAASEPTLSDYAASKRAGEQVLEDFPELLWTIFRPPAVYGPGDKEMLPLLKLFARGIVVMPGGNRGQRLSLLHVDDLCAATLAWLQAPTRHRQYRYELDDGHKDGYSYDDIADVVCTAPLFKKPVRLPLPAGLLDVIARANEQTTRLTGRAPMLTRGKVRELTHSSWLCDSAPFRKASGWQPVVGLAEGVGALFAGQDAEALTKLAPGVPTKNAVGPTKKAVATTKKVVAPRRVTPGDEKNAGKSLDAAAMRAARASKDGPDNPPEKRG